jgi:hypothetical protein
MSAYKKVALRLVILATLICAAVVSQPTPAQAQDSCQIDCRNAYLQCVGEGLEGCQEIYVQCLDDCLGF